MRIGKPSYHLTKRVFGLKNQAHEFEDATWTWVCKRGLPTAEKEPSENYWSDEITPVNPMDL